MKHLMDIHTAQSVILSDSGGLLSRSTGRSKCPLDQQFWHCYLKKNDPESHTFYSGYLCSSEKSNPSATTSPRKPKHWPKVASCAVPKHTTDTDTTYLIPISECCKEGCLI